MRRFKGHFSQRNLLYIIIITIRRRSPILSVRLIQYIIFVSVCIVALLNIIVLKVGRTVIGT